MAASTGTPLSESTPILGDKPHQPLTFRFPKRQFGNKTVVKRSFQPQWFQRWTWIHYDEDHDLAYCYLCTKAYKEGKFISCSRLEYTYISKGYSNWKDATVNFAAHDKSSCHKEAILKVVTLPATTRNIGEQLCRQYSEQLLERRQCLLKILSCIRYLCRQGLPLRGRGTEEDSNYYIQLLRLRGEDDHRVIHWLQKKTDKYTSGEAQNELLKTMAHQVLRKISNNLQGTNFLTVMADETTDISNREQVVICLRWVSETLDVHEEFVGLHMVDSIDANTLVKVIKDTLLRFNLSLSRIRGQCYDGASSMAGARSGVATQLLQEEPKALYTHCYGHALNLTCGDTMKQCKLMRDTLDVTYEIAKLIKKSPRRDVCFTNIKSETSPDTPGIRLLCPTRWTVRASALKSIAENYTVLLETWDECLECARDTETKARILGVKSQMCSFDFFFGTYLGELVLSHSDNLSKTLQRKDISAAEGQTVADMTVKTLQSIRSEEKFKLFWQKITTLAQTVEVDEPQLPRSRKRPKRFEVGEAEAEFSATVEDHYRRIYFEALDLIISCIKNRFDQPGYKVYKNLQNLLLKVVNKDNYEAELSNVIEFYGSDFDGPLLETQLTVLSSNFNTENASIMDIVDHLKSMSPAQKCLLSQVFQLIKLILVMPATNAVSERTFSALRRVKTYLRSTMSQARLNHLMLLYVHREVTDSLDLIQVANEFISDSDHRQSIFGTFKQSDLQK